MSLTVDNDLRARLTGVESEISAFRDRLAVAQEAQTAAKRAYAASDLSVTSSAYMSAQKAVAKTQEIRDQLGLAQGRQVAVLKLLGAGASSPTVDGGDARTAQRLKSTPGAWLGAALDRRRGGVSGLSEQMRTKALTVGAGVGTTEESSALVDLLTPLTVAARSGIGTITTTSTEVRVPRFTTLPASSWVAELAAFPQPEIGLELVTVEPAKCGLVCSLSIESFADLSPLVLAVSQEQLLRSVALEYDRGLLYGDGVGATPLGVASAPGITIENGVSLDDLGGFVEAVGDLLAASARPGAIVMSPADFTRLLGVTEEDGSRVLLSQNPVGDGSVFTLPGLGVPIYVTASAPTGVGLLYDPLVLSMVVRSEADVAIDPYFDFAHGAVGMRVFVRADVLVGQASGVVRLNFAPAG